MRVRRRSARPSSARQSSRSSKLRTCADRLEHLGAGDGIQPKRAAFVDFEVERVEARLVTIHVHAADPDAALALDRVAVDVGDGERLLLEPSALDRCAHTALARQRGNTEESELLE